MSQPLEKLDLPSSEMHERLRRLFEAVDNAKPRNGLSIDQQKFLAASLLASIITADDRIQCEELTNYATLLEDKLQLPDNAVETMADIISYGLNPTELKLAASALRACLSIEQRNAMINMLWGIALSDGELHPNEEKLVYHVADLFGVKGLRVLAEKLSAASDTEAKPRAAVG